MTRLSPRRFPDRVTVRTVTTAFNDYGEPERTVTDRETPANVQPLDITDDAQAAGQAVKDLRKVYVPAGVAVTTADQVIVGTITYEVTAVRPWRSHTRLEVVHED